MRSIKFIAVLAILSFLPYLGFAGDHPQANFGDYGIRHYSTISSYQSNYIGQVVKYLPNCQNKTEGNYDDKKGFLDAGGSYNTEYTISKISGNDQRMTFLLTEVNGKKKVKMVVNNQEEYYSYGKYTYCITNSYTIPLFLVGKFNQDKANYIGKTFGSGSTKLEVTDALIQDVEWEVGKSHEAYPRIVFEITDKSDGR